MRPSISGVCIAIVLAASASSGQPGAIHQVADAATPAPPNQLPPATKKDGVIKPDVDIDPKIEKTPPNPMPDPANKDVIKPSQNGPQPK
jgi:hypothetical protein